MSSKLQLDVVTTVRGGSIWWTRTKAKGRHSVVCRLNCVIHVWAPWGRDTCHLGRYINPRTFTYLVVAPVYWTPWIEHLTVRHCNLHKIGLQLAFLRFDAVDAALTATRQFDSCRNSGEQSSSTARHQYHIRITHVLQDLQSHTATLQPNSGSNIGHWRVYSATPYRMGQTRSSAVAVRTRNASCR